MSLSFIPRVAWGRTDTQDVTNIGLGIGSGKKEWVDWQCFLRACLMPKENPKRVSYAQVSFLSQKTGWSTACPDYKFWVDFLRICQIWKRARGHQLKEALPHSPFTEMSRKWRQGHSLWKQVKRREWLGKSPSICLQRLLNMKENSQRKRWGTVPVDPCKQSRCSSLWNNRRQDGPGWGQGSDEATLMVPHPHDLSSECVGPARLTGTHTLFKHDYSYSIHNLVSMIWIILVLWK